MPALPSAITSSPAPTETEHAHFPSRDLSTLETSCGECDVQVEGVPIVSGLPPLSETGGSGLGAAPWTGSGERPLVPSEAGRWRPIDLPVDPGRVT